MTSQYCMQIVRNKATRRQSLLTNWKTENFCQPKYSFYSKYLRNTLSLTVWICVTSTHEFNHYVQYNVQRISTLCLLFCSPCHCQHILVKQCSYSFTLLLILVLVIFVPFSVKYLVFFQIYPCRLINNVPSLAIK